MYTAWNNIEAVARDLYEPQLHAAGIGASTAPTAVDCYWRRVAAENKARQMMTVVREAALKNEFLIRAVDAPYENREKLKQRGYRWRVPELQHDGVWWRTSNNREAEFSRLERKTYGREARIPTRRITALERYSGRLLDF